MLFKINPVTPTENEPEAREDVMVGRTNDKCPKVSNRFMDIKTFKEMGFSKIEKEEVMFSYRQLLIEKHFLKPILDIFLRRIDAWLEIMEQPYW